MADTTARTLRLLSLLQRRRFWGGPELADRLGVSERTLRRDIDRLRELGYSVESERGVAGGYRLGAGGDTVLLLDDDEATALAAALHGAAAGTSELAEASLGALGKVLTMLGPADRRRVEALRAATATGPAADRDVPRLATLDVVASACRDQVRLSFDYTAADGARTQRYVEPCRLVALDRRWYLVAHDADRDAWRTFRLDRMGTPVASRNRFEARQPPAEDLYEYVRTSVREPRSLHRVVLEVATDGDTVRTEFGQWVEVEDLGVRRCRVVMHTDSLRWPTHLVAHLDAPVRIVEPPELAEQLRAAARRLDRAADGPSVSRARS